MSYKPYKPYKTHKPHKTYKPHKSYKPHKPHNRKKILKGSMKVADIDNYSLSLPI